jgi:hypothetical protein
MLAHGLVRWAKAELANALTYVWKPVPIGGPQPFLPPRAAPAAGAVAELPARG